MKDRLFISADAQRILAGPRLPAPDRSATALPGARRDARTRAEACAGRLLHSAGVTTFEAVIGGVPCLEVVPDRPQAPWPILYGFGGGFVQGSPGEDLPITAPLCAATGARVIVPDYRLAPEHPWPAAVEDCFAVYRALSERPFAIAGESAGGNLALALMLRAKTEGLPLPGAAALMSPWCDLSNTGDSFIFNDGRDPTLSSRSALQAVRHYAGDTPVETPGISPINGAFDTDFPPCVITTGTRDLHLSQAVRLSHVLRESGVSVDLQVWEGMWHVFEWHANLPEAALSIRRVAAHMQAHMNR